MINLFINYFEHQNDERRKEIDYCLDMNTANENIDNIIFVQEGRRAKYNDFFLDMQDYPNDINIIANADIFFDETITKALEIKQNQCYALTRYEKEGRKWILFGRNGTQDAWWSQDVWIFKGVPKRINANFNLGIWGCDNHFAYLIWRAGYNITNPCSKIKCYHMHRDKNRDQRRGPGTMIGNRSVYKYVLPQ